VPANRCGPVVVLRNIGYDKGSMLIAKLLLSCAIGLEICGLTFAEAKEKSSAGAKLCRRPGAGVSLAEAHLPICEAESATGRQPASSAKKISFADYMFANTTHPLLRGGIGNPNKQNAFMDPPARLIPSEPTVSGVPLNNSPSGTESTTPNEAVKSPNAGPNN
jgi:hypothetical protein